MKKTISLITMVILLALAGCGTQDKPAPAVTAAPEITEGPGVTYAPAITASPVVTDEPRPTADPAIREYYDENKYRFVIDPGTLSFDETENMYVGVSFYDCMLYYYDKVTGESGVLCGKPECQHNDKTCNGMVFSQTNWLWCYNGSIYWYGRNYDEDHYVSGDQARRGIWKMNLDGTGRELVSREGIAMFSAGKSIENIVPYKGHAYILTLTEQVRDGAPIKIYEVCRTALDDFKDYELLLSAEGDEKCSAKMLAADNIIYLNIKTFETIHFDVGTPNETRKTVYDDALYSYNLDSNTTSTLLDIKQSECDFYRFGYYNGSVYFSGNVDKVGVVYRLEEGELIKCIDYSDGESSFAILAGGFAVDTRTSVNEDGSEGRFIKFCSLETGETVYNGPWNLNVLPGNPEVKLGPSFVVGGDDDCVIAYLRFRSRDGEWYYAFMKYSFDDTGMTETLLFWGNTR